MTDNEIIKALECCIKLSVKECPECPYYRKEHCSSALIQDTIDLINRQKAENERLRGKFVVLGRQNGKTEIMHQMIKMSFAEVRAEAVKEFAERLKEKAWHGIWETINHVDVDEIDNLVKEMVGDTV